jgi:pyrroloquinoline quinone biosynthesis protein B
MMMQNNLEPRMIVLGIAQDGGVPHAGCDQDCCKDAWEHEALRRMSACLGIVDPLSGQCWMIDATPDFKWQYHHLSNYACNSTVNQSFDGIFLTHGHVGHYSGLLHLEKAVMNASEIPVYTMPRMIRFLSEHLPWKSMVERGNIVLKPIQNEVRIPLNDRICISPFLVPHRDEFTETVGYMIQGLQKKTLYIPDIDSWEQFASIDRLVTEADRILVDGTFFSAKELGGRDMSQVPHPTIETSLERFASLPASKKAEFYFIHLNHTNPCLNPQSDEYQRVINSGFMITQEGQMYLL